MKTQGFLTRKQLSERWGISVVTVDRLRASGCLPWIDLSAGRGEKPLVRFPLAIIELLETQRCQVGKAHAAV